MNAFKELRIKAGLIQRDVSEALGVHVQLISNIERDICLPPNKHLKKLAKLYKVPLDDIKDIKIKKLLERNNLS